MHTTFTVTIFSQLVFTVLVKNDWIFAIRVWTEIHETCLSKAETALYVTKKSTNFLSHSTEIQHRLTFVQELLRHPLYTNFILSDFLKRSHHWDQFQIILQKNSPIFWNFSSMSSNSIENTWYLSWIQVSSLGSDNGIILEKRCQKIEVFSKIEALSEYIQGQMHQQSWNPILRVLHQGAVGILRVPQPNDTLEWSAMESRMSSRIKQLLLLKV